MLVLTRKVDQKIKIKVGDVVITVMVTEIRPTRVSLGVDAPYYVLIDREEVYEERA